MIPVQKIYDATRQGLDIILWIYPQASECVGVKGKKFKVRDEKTPSACLYQRKSEQGCKPVVEIETGRVFTSIGHAANETGYTYGGMRLLIKQTNKARRTGLHYCLKSAWDRIPNKI